MKEYKLNKDYKEPTQEDVRKYKDFGKLSHAYENMTKRPKPLYKNPKVFLALVIIALLAWLIAEEFTDKEASKEPPSRIEEGQ